MDTQRLYLKVCEQCGCQFESHFAVTRYCSARCANLSKKHKLRDERLQNLGDEVRERERLALLDKNFLTIADAARLLQMSRNTLYKIIKENDIPLKRFSLRTVRIAREDLDKVAAKRTEDFNVSNPIQGPGEDLGKWMTREQVMEKYDVTYSWFYSVLKKRGVKTHMIGTLGFYDRDTMHRLFSNQDYTHITEWYTFDEVRTATGMRTESISDFLREHKIPKMKKNNITYISKVHWDEARGLNVEKDLYYTMAEITDKYGLSRNHLYCVFKEHKVPRIKRGNFVYFIREDVDNILANRKNS